MSSARASEHPELRHGIVAAGGVRLHYVEQGEGPLVLLLHGFPDFWYSWRRQLPALAAAGFRAVAPDQRGYNLSDKPAGVASYDVDRLADDAAALVRHFGGDAPAHVVGHDWGGGVAWHLAARDPALVDRRAIVNAPHPARFARELRRPAQLARSWYMLFFQLPWLPERLFGARDCALLLRTLRRSAPEAFGASELERYREAFERPHALEHAIDWYRAVARRSLRAQPMGYRIARPTMLLWGMRDPYLRPTLTEGLDRWIPDLRVERFDGVGHWAHVEAADRVNAMLVDFLKAR
jgi:pimeloyl-ACP methyl ester carboxylesterase